jgi:hypothetical protein
MGDDQRFPIRATAIPLSSGAAHATDPQPVQLLSGADGSQDAREFHRGAPGPNP